MPKGSNNRKLTDTQVVAIREDKRAARAVAAEYGVSLSLVQKIRTGERRAKPIDEIRKRQKRPSRFFAPLETLAVGGTHLFPGVGANRAGLLTYWTLKTGFRFKTKSTNHGLRVWRIA